MVLLLDFEIFSLLLFPCFNLKWQTMSTVVAKSTNLFRVSIHGAKTRIPLRRISLCIAMKNTSDSSQGKQIQSEELSVPSSSQLEFSRPSNLHFNKIQQPDQDCDCRHKRVFGCFVVREALLDEEYWTAAWLRAESHWEDQSNERYVNNYKRQFADQEFNALKRRCGGQHADKCTCIVVVKNEEKKVKRIALNSVVGTLDVSIRHRLRRETFSRERVKTSIFSTISGTDPHKYGYVSNLCVAKSARRQGIASNMLLLAIEAAKSYGVEEVFVHVHTTNMPAQRLYAKIGFQMVEVPTHQLPEQNYLLSLKT